MAHSLSCTVCGNEFTAKSSWAKYCSGRCRNASNRLRHVEYRRQWTLANRERVNGYARNRSAARPDNMLAVNRRKSLNRKRRVFAHYGGSICACCGETNELFLSLDHINNDGAQHRKELFGTSHGRNNGGSHAIYAWAIRNNFPPVFQVLCMNCNWGKARNRGTCPHHTAQWPSEIAIHG